MAKHIIGRMRRGDAPAPIHPGITEAFQLIRVTAAIAGQDTVSIDEALRVMSAQIARIQRLMLNPPKDA